MRKLWGLFIAILALALPCQTTVAQQPDCSLLISSGTNEYPPFMWFSTEKRQPQGALVDYINWHNNEYSIKIDNRFTGAWARTQRQAQQIDLLFGLFYNKERAATLDFLHPPLTSSVARIWLNSTNDFSITDLSDLKGRQGATVNGFSLGDKFDSYAESDLELFYTRSIRQSFKMLASKRVDFVVYEELPGLSVLSTMENTANLKLAPYIIAKENVFMAINKDSPCNTSTIKAELEASLQKASQLNLITGFIKQAKEQWKQSPELSAN